MEPQQSPDNQNQNSQQFNHSPQTPVSHSERNKGNGRLWKVLSALLVVILLLATAGAGYLYYSEVQAHDKTKQELTEVKEELSDIKTEFEEQAQVLQDARLEPGFRKVLQDNANRNCSSNSAILFNTTTSPEKNGDGSIKKFFAVGQYVCNNGEQILSEPVRFVAAQSYDEATWEFTFGSGTASPVSLPSYIFDTDPALFNRKYNNPNRF